MRPLKSIERWAREFRSFLLPSHYRAAERVRARSRGIPPGQPICLFDFTSVQIDNVMGRYLYHLVTEFSEIGYHPVFSDRYRFLATAEKKAYKALVFDRPYTVVRPGKLRREPDIVVTDDEIGDRSRRSLRLRQEASKGTFAGPGSPTKVVRVRYEPRRPQAGEPALPFPFFVHPKIHESEQVERLDARAFTAEPRAMRVFFAGNAERPKYDDPRLTERFGVMTRVGVLDAARRSLGPDRLYLPDRFEAIAPPDAGAGRLTIATLQSCPIPTTRWIETLARADFFLAAPGVEIPLCHNLIESLAAGTVPILEYPRYLDPPLQDGLNCLVFDSAGSLHEALERALGMPAEEVAELRRLARRYYDSYLRPGRFARRVVDHPARVLSLYVNAYRVPLPD